MNRSGGVRTVLTSLAPALTLVAAVLLFWVIAPDRPLGLLDVRTILIQTVIVATVGLGMTVVIASGGIDLSVGSAVALSGVVAAEVMNADLGPDAAPWQPALALIAACGAGALCGAYNGLLHTLLGLPAFIVTLGTLGFYRGAAKWISDSSPVYAKAGWLSEWVAPIPSIPWLVVAPAVWLMLALAFGAAILMHRTVFGRHALAIGSNEEAARRAGVSVRWVKLRVYAICGLCVGLAGVLQFARLGGSGDPTVQVGLELRAIAAVVIGGASLTGGVASVFGTICGALLMALLDNRSTALGWPNYVQELLVGHIIIAAVALDRIRGRRLS
jgi:ribose transport system permease protein